MRLLTLLALALSLPALANPKAETPSADAAFKDLEAGNARFIAGKPSHAHEDAAWRQQLAKGQAPEAIILSCSDSRVPPELVFDKGLGELFTVRVAGNIVGAATMASIEYAVEHLGTKLIVVMGHESCGAVKAAVETPLGKSAGSPDLDALISSIKPALEKDRAPATAVEPNSPKAEAGKHDPRLRAEVMQNVDAVAERLLKRSPILRRHLADGGLQIRRAIYGLESGKVDFWQP